MNFFDIITIIAFVWAVVSGWRSGLVAQLLSLAGIVAGLIFAIRFGVRVGTMLGIDPQFAAVAGFAVTFVAAVIIAAILAKFLRSMLSFIGLHLLDTLLGITLSLVKALLILSVAYAAFDSLNADMKLVDKRYIASSRTFRPVKGVSECIFPYIDWLKRQIPTTDGKPSSKNPKKCESAV